MITAMPDLALFLVPRSDTSGPRATALRVGRLATRLQIIIIRARLCVCVEVSAVVNGPRFGHVVCVCHGLLPGRNEEREREKKVYSICKSGSDAVVMSALIMNLKCAEVKVVFNWLLYKVKNAAIF